MDDDDRYIEQLAKIFDLTTEEMWAKATKHTGFGPDDLRGKMLDQHGQPTRIAFDIAFADLPTGPH